MRWREPIDAGRVVARAMGDTWDALFSVAVINICWLGLSATIVLAPVASAALFEAMDGLVQGRTPGLGEFLSTVRRRFVDGWLWALWGAAGLSVAALVAGFYGAQSGVTAALAPLAMVLGLLFLVSLLYVWPFVAVAGEGGSLGRAIRNALLTVLAAPIFALTLALLLGLLLAVSLVLVMPIVFVTPALIALAASHAVRDRLRAFGKLLPGQDQARI